MVKEEETESVKVTEGKKAGKGEVIFFSFIFLISSYSLGRQLFIYTYTEGSL